VIELDPTLLTIREVGDDLRSGRYTCTDLTAAVLERIDRIDPELNSYVTVTRVEALRQAAEATAELASGTDRGPLHGIPVAVKDIFSIRGVPTTAGSALLAGWQAADDAAAIQRLRTAGAVIVGTHTLHEFAYGPASTERSAFPPARNPWVRGHVPGGSSSGSAAAVASGLCFAALGSDTGGSVRKPAALCGVVGLKPTRGRISRAGMIPLSHTLDHVGILARTVEDCALVLGAVAGHDPGDEASVHAPVPDYRVSLRDGVEGLRLGVSPGWLDDQEGTHPEVVAACQAAVDCLVGCGARVVEIDHQALVAARDVNTLIVAAEAYALHEEPISSRPEAYGSTVRSRLREGAFLSAADYIKAQEARRRISNVVRAHLEDVDVIVSPTSPFPAEAFADVDWRSRYRSPSFTNAFNLSGLPALSVPCGFSSGGLPIGLQIAGRAFDEPTVLRVALTYEQQTSWHTRHPGFVV
jgi:aspartyl-tRNA(Asn)/glutamyl-tRNA(Gln) amidotransferase subunit A